MIYFIQAVTGGPIKIGLTDGESASERLNSLQTGNPKLLRVLATQPGGREEEAELHRRFAKDRQAGEWFSATAELKQHIGEAASPFTGQPPRLQRMTLKQISDERQLAYSQKDAARMLGVSLSTFQRHIRPELSQPKFVGGRVLFLHRDIERWLHKS